MSKQEQKKYKFHLKIDAEMKNNLINLSMFKKAGNISEFITKILILLSPGMEKMHIKGVQQYSRYDFVCGNKEIERKSVYVDLPEKVYRKLKSMHQDLNFYSMAQLLRLALRVFLGFVAVFGDAVESKLLELYREWKKKRDLRKYEWKPVEELLRFIYQKPRQSWFLTLYSKKFQPISIYRL